MTRLLRAWRPPASPRDVTQLSPPHGATAPPRAAAPPAWQTRRDRVVDRFRKIAKLLRSNSGPATCRIRTPPAALDATGHRCGAIPKRVALTSARRTLRSLTQSSFRTPMCDLPLAALLLNDPADRSNNRNRSLPAVKGAGVPQKGGYMGDFVIDAGMRRERVAGAGVNARRKGPAWWLRLRPPGVC